MGEKIKLLPRMTGWLLITLLLIAIIAALKPGLLPVSLYKLSLITMAGVVGYWIDRSLFPYARPDGYLNAVDWHTCGKLDHAADMSVVQGYELIFAAAMLRRAIIIGAAMLAVSLGV